MIAKATNKIRKLRAALYARMSSDDQEGSIERQTPEMEALAAREGYSINRRYADKGISGDSGTEERDDFARMLNDAEKGLFDVLLVWHTNRLSRKDEWDAIEDLNRLRHANILLHSVNEGKMDLNTFASRLVMTVTQRGNSEYLTELSRKVLEGQRTNAKAGWRTGGAAAYGYDRGEYAPDGKTLVRRLKPKERQAEGNKVRDIPSEDPIKLAAIEYAFTRFASADLTTGQLAREMTTRNYPAPENNKTQRKGYGWSRYAVEAILRNPVYVGTRRFGACSAGKYHTLEGAEIKTTKNPKGTSRQKTPEEAIMLTEGAHEGLIDKTLFDRVQRKLDARQKHLKQAKAEFALSGLLKCGHCGRVLWGTNLNTRARNGRHYKYVNYCCPTYSDLGPNHPANKTCKHRHAIAAAEVEGAAFAMLQGIIGIDSMHQLEDLKDKLTVKHPAKDETAGIERRLADLEKRVGRLRKAVEATDDDGVIQDLRDRIAERDEARAELAAARERTAPVDVDARAAEILDNMLDLQERLRSADAATAREVYRQAIEEITVTWQPIMVNGREKCYTTKGFTLEITPSSTFFQSCGAPWDSNPQHPWF
jgi:site-specific DNA recombinase